VSDPVSIGDIIGEKYAISGVLGRGGIGVVYAAEHVTLRRRVALKFLRPELLGRADVVQRFLREGRAAAQLQSEHVARVLDADATQAGAPYLVMELLEGRDLRSLVRDAGPLQVDDAVDFIRQACEGLAEAHAVGIVHRDLKPANLFCSRGPGGAPMIKVLDFGIAKFQSANVAGDDIEMTGPATMLGSRPFMSPEQMLDAKEVDARADVWALGTILFYLLTGQSPFEGECSSDLMLNILQGEPRALSSLRPDAPAGLDAVVRRCVEKLRDKRYANVCDLWRALAPFARPQAAPTSPKLGTETLELPVVAIWPPPPTPPSDEETMTLVCAPKPPRRAWMLVAAALTAAIALATTAVAVTGSSLPHTARAARTSR
jgi:eukaryotic-like serine/threonine-protein kinase